MADDVDPIDAELEKLDAELEKLDAEETKPLSSGIRRLLPALLAVVTLGGFAGVVWYAYNTGIREGSEFAAPVLKPDGPSKVAPTNPGGQKIADQDKLVYGKIDKSTEGRKVERLLPPPEKPLPVPIVRKLPPVSEPKLEVPKAPPTSELPAPPTETLAEKAALKNNVTPEKEAPAVAKVAPSAGTSDVKPQKAERAAPPPPKVAVKPPAPPKPPAAPKSPAVAPKPTQTASKPDPAKGYRIQISSHRSEAAAKSAWAKWVKQHGAILGKLTLLVKRAELDKRGVYYRVQAGPLKDLAAARRVCDALKQKKVGCLVIRP